MLKRHRWTSILVAGAVFAACGDSTGPGDGDPPVLPEVESMLFDLDAFSNSPAQEGPARQVGAGLNWTTAALSVGVANLAVVIHLAVPVATWRAATQRVPVFEDGRWHWRFSVTEGNTTYGSDLAGFEENGDRVFEMTVTATPLGLTDFLWFTGRAPIGGNSGEWQFFDPNNQSVVSGRIEWSHPDDDIWTLTFFAESGPTAGDTLAYVVDGTARSVTYTDVSEGTTVVVEWDHVTRAGSITAPNYNSGAQACWDTNLQNVPCP